MQTKVRILNPGAEYKEKAWQQYESHGLGMTAKFASALLERWGPVMCESDGEDAAGRQKVRTLSAQETVDKACAIAESAMNEFEKRGWLVALPDLEEINAKKETEKV